MKESLHFAVITESDVDKREQLVGKLVQWAGYKTSVCMEGGRHFPLLLSCWDNC